MDCIKCGTKIPDGRLKALPNTKTCTGCSTSGKVAGFAMISGKTEYSEIQLVDPEVAERLTKLQERKGYGISDGVKFDSELKEEDE